MTQEEIKVRFFDAFMEGDRLKADGYFALMTRTSRIELMETVQKEMRRRGMIAEVSEVKNG